MQRHDLEASVKACYATWSDNYYDNYYGEKAAYPPVHRDILKKKLAEAKAVRILDAGCGPASFLRELDGGLDLHGFDLTPEMIDEARRIMGEKGYPGKNFHVGSVLDKSAFIYPDEEPYDAAVCCGVLPHIPAEHDTTVLKNLHASLKQGGLALVEARNELFALFTANRYSYEFFLDRLLRADELKAAAGSDQGKVEESLDAIKGWFRTDLPPKRTGSQENPGYDEVLSRTHNPLVLQRQFQDAGFTEVELLFYHYHCLPPMFEKDMPEFFRAAGLAMEDPTDWRGYFMASAFIVAGRKA